MSGSRRARGVGVREADATANAVVPFLVLSLREVNAQYEAPQSNRPKWKMPQPFLSARFPCVKEAKVEKLPSCIFLRVLIAWQSFCEHFTWANTGLKLASSPGKVKLCSFLPYFSSLPFSTLLLRGALHHSRHVLVHQPGERASEGASATLPLPLSRRLPLSP